MSAFTDWNGPQGSNVRANDLIQLANAYSELVTKLNQHLQDTTAGDNVHSSRDYVDQQVQAIRALLPNFNAFLTKAEADDSVTGYAKKAELAPYATKAEISNFITASALDGYLTASDLSSNELIQLIQSDIETLAGNLERVEDWKNDPEGLIVTNLKATGYVEGLLSVIEQLNFTDKQVSAEVGGSNTIGVYYVFGMLKDKAGSCTLKFKGDKPFDANIMFADDSLAVVTSNKDLKGLCFMVVKGVDNQNEEHKYLAIQSVDWMSQFASTDGYGLFDKLDFEASGINFIPKGSVGWKMYNGTCEVLCECLSEGPGLAFSKLGTLVLGEQICREARNPYLTLDDVTALDCVGLISHWPDYDPETGTAINVPTGYHACDGTPVDPDDPNVSDEFYSRWQVYPLEDYAIIKTQATIKVNMDVPVRSSLAEAVCALHGIKFYMGIDSLPVTAKVGEPVIVQTGDTFAVYAFTANDGWRKYTTQYNDVNKTIAAVASVIAAEHHADVYTVYTSVSDLPTGLNVETDSLAIVFDGVAYSVFKYNGTAWEVQV